MFPFFISSISLFIYPLFSHNVTRFLFCLPLSPYNCFCICVYVCEFVLRVFLFSSPLSLFALSCSLMFSIALSLARPPAQNLSPFSLPSLSVLFSFSHTLALTHTHVSHRVACLCFLLPLSFAISVLLFVLLCFFFIS